MGITMKIAGAGAFVPSRVITNDRIVQAIPGWTADQIGQKTGIMERRFLWDFDNATGRTIVPPDDGSVYPRSSVDMCEVALSNALKSAGMQGSDIDMLFVISATTDELNFCHDANMLHQRFGCKPETQAFVVDSGCGGAMYMMDLARKLIAGGECKAIAVVAAHFPSAFLDRDAFTSSLEVEGKMLNACLTMYLFGDGAGALILTPTDGGPSGFVASHSGAAHSELMVRRGGGALHPPYPGRSTLAQHAYYVNGKKVADAFPAYMRRAIDAVLASSGIGMADFDRFYLHQANKRLVEGFVQSYGLPPGKVPIHMDRYGNTNAAGTLILLAEDIAAGNVALGSGQSVLFAAIGAGIHYGAHIVRL